MEGCKQLQNTNMRNLPFLLFLPLIISSSLTHLPLGQTQSLWSNQATPYEGVPSLVDLEYHMGPVLAASPTNLYVIWYGHWNPKDQSILRDFLYSLSSTSSPRPSVYEWWQTIRLYTDQTGSNITGDLVLAGEAYDWEYSQGRYLSREAMQHVIRNAVSKGKDGLPLDPHSGVYLVLTSQEVQVQEFCRAVCGFHYFTFPYVVGVTVPYAWVGHSGVQCPGFCAYPFALPSYGGNPPAGRAGYELLGAPNRNPGIDGMVSVLAHELAEVSSNPLVNAWYAGDDPTAPTEIADLCMGVYGSGAGGGFVGSVYKDSWGNAFNLHGIRGRKFLVQWVWNPIMKQCFGPNSIYS